MIRGYIYRKKVRKAHVNLSVKVDKLQLNKKFRTDGVRLSVQRRSFISYNQHLVYQTLLLVSLGIS